MDDPRNARSWCGSSAPCQLWMPTDTGRSGSLWSWNGVSNALRCAASWTFAIRRYRTRTFSPSNALSDSGDASMMLGKIFRIRSKVFWKSERIRIEMISTTVHRDLLLLPRIIGERVAWLSFYNRLHGLHGSWCWGVYIGKRTPST